ncbi:DUF3309 domain-containing protein [Undibacterium arcticum]|uniref:DUF3309 domain-containing protein n=1 Tax=Undibacterium arcticum TaxID=1762892 RepID=A0ABV7F2W3_9BURK
MPGEWSMGVILLVIMVLVFVGSLPHWPHSRTWGYGPSGGVGVVMLIVAILVLLHRI